MNGTKYTDPDSMRELAARLADVSDASTFLSVRTPAQWRKITGEAAPDGWTENPLAKRLGLFNDGMLGSVSDYGTYSDNTRQDAGDFRRGRGRKNWHFRMYCVAEAVRRGSDCR